MAATIMIAAAVAVITGLAIRSIVKDHKDGIGACGYKCSDCELHCDSSQIPDRFKLKNPQT